MFSDRWSVLPAGRSRRRRHCGRSEPRSSVRSALYRTLRSKAVTRPPPSTELLSSVPEEPLSPVEVARTRLLCGVCGRSRLGKGRPSAAQRPSCSVIRGRQAGRRKNFGQGSVFIGRAEDNCTLWFSAFHLWICHVAGFRHNCAQNRVESVAVSISVSRRRS